MAAVWFIGVMGLVAAIYLDGQADYARAADVIIVLGAGLRANDEPGPALTRRSAHAASLWQQGLAPFIICTGGRTGHSRRTEASACRELLLADGVPAAAILMEDRSKSTEENAIYTGEILRERGWQAAILVSDSFHVLRARWLFTNRNIPVYTSPVPASRMRAIDYVVAVGREIAALHWQVIKQFLNLSITHVTGI